MTSEQNFFFIRKESRLTPEMFLKLSKNHGGRKLRNLIVGAVEFRRLGRGTTLGINKSEVISMDLLNAASLNFEREV